MQKFRSLTLAVMLAAQICAVAHAADDHDHPRAERAGPRPGVRPDAGRPAIDAHGQVFDGRYNHGRYYPAFGAVRPDLPVGYRPYFRGSDRFYFSGGVWYAPRGPGYVVVRPPVGLVIGVLPPYYSTFWFGGVPYYYADNVYYTWQPDQNGYAVANAPPNADGSAPDAGSVAGVAAGGGAPPPDASAPDGQSAGGVPPSGVPPSGVPPSGPASGSQMDLIVYPKNGQGKDQQAADQYECHTWAKGQTGFDPTQPAGGTSGDPYMARNNYNRAMSACLQARGYQVN